MAARLALPCTQLYESDHHVHRHVSLHDPVLDPELDLPLAEKL